MWGADLPIGSWFASSVPMQLAAMIVTVLGAVYLFVQGGRVRSRNQAPDAIADIGRYYMQGPITSVLQALKDIHETLTRLHTEFSHSREKAHEVSTEIKNELTTIRREVAEIKRSKPARRSRARMPRVPPTSSSL